MTAVAAPTQERCAGYLTRAFRSRGEVIDDAVGKLESKDFDTIVVTGVSGLLIGSILAHILDKHLVVVRKDEDVSTHSQPGMVEGILGGRWLFVDDFVSSGETLLRVKRKVQERANDRWWGEEDHETEYVGFYGYVNGKFDAPGDEGGWMQ